MIVTILEALRGWLWWLKIKRRYGIHRNGNFAIMMPDDDRELNEFALRHIDDFLHYRKGHSVVIFTTDEWTKNNAQRFSKHIIAVTQITEREDYYFRCYYSYYSPYCLLELVMISLQTRDGKRLAAIENINGINKEDMVCLGLYIIRNWTRNEVLDG